MTVASMERDDLAASIAAGSITVVDALPAHAFARRHLPGAINVVAEQTDEEIVRALPGPDAPIAVYSTDEHCDRAPTLAARLTDLGYLNVRLFREGIEDWAGHDLPLVHG